MARKKEVTIYDEVITRSRAVELLRKNDHNRRVSERHLRNLCGAIERGEWKFNGDTIRIDTKGQILDGQHRLMAIEKTGVEMRQIVVSGLPPDVFDTIDVGKKRNFADVLSLGGHRNIHETSSALRKLDMCLFNKGSLSRRTHVEMENLLKKFPEIHEMVNYCRKTPRHVMPVSAMSACYTMFSRVDKEKAKSWVDAMISGEVIKKNAVYVLREQLIRNRTGHQRFRDSALMALCIDCWHFWCAKEIPVGGQRFTIPKEFPELIGWE